MTSPAVARGRGGREGPKRAVGRGGRCALSPRAGLSRGLTGPTPCGALTGLRPPGGGGRRRSGAGCTPPAQCAKGPWAVLPVFVLFGLRRTSPRHRGRRLGLGQGLGGDVGVHSRRWATSLGGPRTRPPSRLAPRLPANGSSVVATPRPGPAAPRPRPWCRLTIPRARNPVADVQCPRGEGRGWGPGPANVFSRPAAIYPERPPVIRSGPYPSRPAGRTARRAGKGRRRLGPRRRRPSAGQSLLSPTLPGPSPPLRSDRPLLPSLPAHSFPAPAPPTSVRPSSASPRPTPIPPGSSRRAPIGEGEDRGGVSAARSPEGGP